MMDIQALQKQKQQLQSSERPPRAREAAKMLGISEAEYVALSYPETATPIDVKRLQDLLIAIYNLGEVMALSRNDHLVLEHHGVYANPKFVHNHMILQSPTIDLRLRLNEIGSIFAVNENNRHSIQFFDLSGRAVHKIYLTEQSDVDSFEYLLKKYAVQFSMPTPQAPAGKDLLGIQLSDNAWIEFRKHWNELTDAHQINPLLKRYGLTRPQAYRQLADVASRLPTHSIKFMLEQIALLKIPVLIFAPNGVCTQIHNGTIEKLVETGPWFNVLDPKFNMHLQLASVHQVWRVYKPNEQQSIESIELFNDNEQPIAMIYLHTSARENPLLRDKWQGLLKSLAEQSFENRVA